MKDRGVPRWTPRLFVVCYAAVLSAPAIALKMLFTAVPAAPTAPIAMSAINATSNAYSSRSALFLTRERLDEVKHRHEILPRG